MPGIRPQHNDRGEGGHGPNAAAVIDPLRAILATVVLPVGYAGLSWFGGRRFGTRGLIVVWLASTTVLAGLVLRQIMPPTQAGVADPRALRYFAGFVVLTLVAFGAAGWVIRRRLAREAALSAGTVAAGVGGFYAGWIAGLIPVLAWDLYRMF